MPVDWIPSHLQNLITISFKNGIFVIICDEKVDKSVSELGSHAASMRIQ